MPNAAAVPAAVLDRLKAAVGPAGFLEDDADKAPFLRDERELYRGATPLVLRPGSTAEVAAVVRICAEAGIGVVPQGGNTGYCGGSIPDDSGRQVLVSLARMRRVREVDPLDYTITVEAGCVLADVQRAAEAADRLFPLSLAAEGSCQIGGNLSTNAGGTAVLRYGNARDLVLGLEVVLPDGEIWDGLRRLRKDNSGYALRHLFLGAEGTLGIITAAVLKLFPRPTARATALVAVADPQAAVALLAGLREASGDLVTTFEYVHRAALDLGFAHVEDLVDPFGEVHEHYALVELSASGEEAGLDDAIESVLAPMLESGAVADAVVAQSGEQAAQLWRLRETLPEAQKRAGGCIKHDVSVPVSAVPAFLAKAGALAAELIPGVRVVPFGHVGDGNVHFNLTQPAGADREAFLARTADVTPRIHDLAVEMGGSFSAEHGIGRLKRDELERYKSEVELDLLRLVKDAIDPEGLMNPGKVLGADASR